MEGPPKKLPPKSPGTTRRISPRRVGLPKHIFQAPNSYFHRCASPPPLPPRPSDSFSSQSAASAPPPAIIRPPHP
eukprot:605952-Amorphochlora_amoeboformis.AAC.1